MTWHVSHLQDAVSDFSALVLAPNILRTTSQVLFTVFTNSSFESRFVHHLLTHLDCSVVDPEYSGYVPTQPL